MDKLEKKFPSYKDYLDKTFLEELNFKLWTTKGSRFVASKRLEKLAFLSNLSMALLSVYLIIAGLLTVYQIFSSKLINANLLAFGSTAISILLLVLSQIENSKEYKLKSHLFHSCSLEIGKIYNKVRIFKTFGEKTDDDKVKFCEIIEKEYQQILSTYENHKDIDYHVFTTRNPEYFGLKNSKVKLIHLSAYFKTTFIYHFYIGFPVLFVILFLFFKR